MKKPFLGLRTVIYRVPDLAAATKWYAAAFATEPYFNEPYYVGFNIGGFELGLQPDDASLGDNVLAYWGTEDISAQYQHLIHMGAQSHEAPENVGENITVATVKDPWGNILGLIYNPAFNAQ